MEQDDETGLLELLVSMILPKRLSTMNSSAPKLDHKEFAGGLATHLREQHYDSGVVVGYLKGTIRTLEVLGFSEEEAYRIIFEHLRPEFFMDTRDDSVEIWLGLRRIIHTREWVMSEWDAPTAQSSLEQYRQEDERFQFFYSNPKHSKQFWSQFLVEWLPQYKAANAKRQRQRDKPIWQRFLEKV